MCCTIFQVSAAGTCLGCLLVGLSFLAKVWCDFILIIRLTTSHSSEQCHFFLHGTGTSLGKGPELSAGFGRHSGTLLFIAYFPIICLERSRSGSFALSLVRVRTHTNCCSDDLYHLHTRFSVDHFHWVWEEYPGL